VAVNRIWAGLFGTGLVETEEDFGLQGTLPSNPALLDWVSIEFMSPLHGETPWDVKRIIKLIVNSSAYRQSSVVTPLALEKDPRDRMLSRYPRRRLAAENLRDQALAISGLLAPTIGGPSVFPAQPGGLWQAAFNGDRNYPTSTGADKYRRGLYTFWRRTVPPPNMAAFDAPSREICTFRRFATNTPLQALVTMNDPVYVEMAQAMARRLVREGGDTTASRITYGLKLALSRPPSAAQVKTLTDLYNTQCTAYSAAQSADAAKKLATDPLGPIPADLKATPAELAALTIACNVILNMDGVLTVH
jgi:hypothetical protein